MKFATLHKASLFSMALISTLPLLLSGELNFYLGPLFGFLLVAGWWLPERVMKHQMYRTVITAIVAVLFVVQGLRIANGEHLAIASIEFASILLGIKLCSRTQFGDAQQIVLLSFVSQIASTIVGYDVSYGLFFVLFVFLAPLSMFATQLQKELESRFTKADEDTRQRIFHSKKVVTVSSLFWIPVSALVLLLLTALLFLAIPRWGFGMGGGHFWANSWQASPARSKSAICPRR